MKHIFKVNIKNHRKEIFLFLFLGFISGIPFLLILSTLTFWLTELKIPNTIIGMFMFTTIPYSLKPLWAPCIDNFNIPFLGSFLESKYSWGVASNILLTISIVGLGFSDPQQNLGITIFFAFLVSFCAATQDIVIDTLRIDLTPYNLSGVVSAMESIGFRSGMITSGTVALYIAEYFSWSIAYGVMGCIVIFGSLAFCSLNRSSLTRKRVNIQEIIHNDKKKSFNSFLVAQKTVSKSNLIGFFFYPVYHIISQKNISFILAFVFFFKVADSSLNSMSAPFIHDLGFSKIEYANISKFFGTIMMMAGSIAGGLWISRWNTLLCLKAYGYLQIISAIMFIIQTHMGYNHVCLALTLGLESFVSGFGSVAFLAYLSKFCISSTATSFTLFYSFGSLFRVLISLAAGCCADHLGWIILFCLVILFTIPLFYYLKRIENIFGAY